MHLEQPDPVVALANVDRVADADFVEVLGDDRDGATAGCTIGIANRRCSDVLLEP